MIKDRLWAILLCLVMVLPHAALAAGEEPFVPLTQSDSVLTETGVTVTGTRAVVDYSYLHQLSDDVVGWLYQESTGFSQPIVQGDDNEHYLHHAYDGTKLHNKGSVLLDAASPADFSANAVYLYGMGRSNCCFQPFNSYSKQAWYASNHTLRLMTPTGDWQADVFALVDSTWRDNQSWRVPEEEAAFNLWLEGILAKNRIVSLTDTVPVYGDRLMVMVINNKEPKRNVVLATLRPITYETQAETNLIKQELDRRQSTSGVKTVAGLGDYMVYAQNDPIWNRMQYESERNPTYRVFGDGGCGPTAAAIALANLVDRQELPNLQQYTLDGSGTLMCPCSVNRVYCNFTHAPYRISSAEEYWRYLPVVMGDFAAGNNKEQIVSRRVGYPGSNMNFFNLVCDLFGITRLDASDLSVGLEMLKGHTGTRLMMCYALPNSPFTNSSHYVVVAGVDDEYFYILDPLFRDSYATTDSMELLEVLDKGVTRIRIDRSYDADLTPVYVLERPAA